MGEEQKSDSSVTRPQPVFIQDFVDVESPFESVRGRFIGDSEWMTPIASAASEDGETLRMRIGPTWSSGLVTREVHVTLGPAREGVDSILRSLSWTASEHAALFPSLDGDIELAPLDPEITRISLNVVYTPPLGDFGARIDRVILHRVAQSTVRSFISRIAANLRGTGEAG